MTVVDSPTFYRRLVLRAEGVAGYPSRNPLVIRAGIRDVVLRSNYMPVENGRHYAFPTDGGGQETRGDGPSSLKVTPPSANQPMPQNNKQKERGFMQLDAEKIRAARRDLGISQEHVAGRGDTSAASVRRAESGLPVKPSTARRLARGLGVELSVLRSDTDPAQGIPKEEVVAVEKAMTG